MPIPDERLVCAFCGKRRREVRKLIAGPLVDICDGCARVATRLAREGGAAGLTTVAFDESGAITASTAGEPACSFCGVKIAEEPRVTGAPPLVVAAKAVICRECVGLVNDILGENQRRA